MGAAITEISPIEDQPAVEMAETEERPAKMRKLDAKDDGDDVPQFAPTPASPHTPTNKVDVTMSDAGTLANVEVHAEHAGEQHDDAVASAEDNDSTKIKMSKSQLKKLRKKAEWEAGKEWRKQHKKEKEKAKKAKVAEEKAALLAQGILPEPKKGPPPLPIPVPVTVMIDCDFDKYMLDKEIMSLGQQVTRSYSDVKNGRYRANMVVSSFGGRMKERYETVLNNYHLGWKGVGFTDKRFDEAAKEAHDKMIGKEGGKLAGALVGQLPPPKPEEGAEAAEAAETSEPIAPNQEELSAKYPKPTEPQLIYLSSDSEHTLETLSPYTTYVIGGIVDKNRHKGLCHRRAVELGIPTAKLPIGEYMQMQSRTVLATNHVVEIMVDWLESGSWEQAFLKCIPKRKEATLKRNKDKSKKGGEEGEEHHDEDEAGNHEEDANAQLHFEASQVEVPMQSVEQ